MSKNFRKVLILAVAFIVILIILAGVLIYFRADTLPKVQSHLDSAVDDATYQELQALMLKTPLSKPEVIKDSLKFYDIDGDGKNDVLGFLKLTFGPNDSTYIFTTWKRSENTYERYDDAYNDFRIYGKNSCAISEMALKTVVLNCADLGESYSVTLRFQDNGQGYYRDVAPESITFKGGPSWLQYYSQKAGVQFYYPADIKIAEKSYNIYGNLVNVISGSRADKNIFEIHTTPSVDRGGGGVIDNAWKGVFLKLADGSYLSRGIVLASGQQGFFYQKTNIHEKNNVGSTFNSFESRNVKDGTQYTLFTPIETGNELGEVDNIFSSITYLEALMTKDSKTVFIPTNVVLFADTVSLGIPGEMKDSEPSSGSTAIASKNMTITFIDSPIYKPSSFSMSLYSYRTIGEGSFLGGGGYDAEKETCFNYDKKPIPLEKIGSNYVCHFGFGDAGFVATGYYIIDPNKKYIFSISEAEDYSDPYNLIFPLDLDKIAETVHFFSD